MPISHSLPVHQTPRPLLGEIIEVPEGISCPERDDRYVIDHPHCGPLQRGKLHRINVGRVVEVGVNLISVQFFGYPYTWDYSEREYAQFTLAATLP